MREAQARLGSNKKNPDSIQKRIKKINPKNKDEKIELLLLDITSKFESLNEVIADQKETIKSLEAKIDTMAANNNQNNQLSLETNKNIPQHHSGKYSTLYP